MNKAVVYNYNDGLNRDVSKSKHPISAYYDAKNIRIINTDSQSSLSLTNEKGNKFILSIPSVNILPDTSEITYNNKSLKYSKTATNELSDITINTNSGPQFIVGHAITRDSIILISTSNNKFDCVWEVKELYQGTFDLTLLYIRELNLSTSNPVQILYNYENENIQKIYWVDGINQLRFLNIKHSIANKDDEELIDLNSNFLNIVSDYSLSQPTLESISGGGTNTSGMVQYSYNLYKLNGAQTTISPFSDLIPLDNGSVLGGGDLNEIVGSAPIISIPTLDPKYTNIKVYAIKYTSFNEIPSVSLIVDEAIDTYTDYTFVDTGSKINDLSLSEFIFLGSNPITPKHIESKDSRLFVSNYKETAYDLDVDTRAYSFNNLGVSKLWDENGLLNANGLPSGPFITVPTNYIVPREYDSINPDYSTYKYHKNGSTLGGEGLYISYELIQKNKSQLTQDLKYLKFLKDNEIYRIGIQFYNKLGQKSDVKWVADFRAPIGNLEGNYNILKVNIKSTEFNNYITSLNLEEKDIPVGYKILRAERGVRDMTILCQGSLTGMMIQTKKEVTNFNYWIDEENRKDESKNEVKIPIPISRGFSTPATENVIFPTEHLKMMNEGRAEDLDEIYRDVDPEFKRQQSWQYTKMMQMHSPDLLFNTGLTFSSGLNLKVKGILESTETNKRFKQIDIESKSIERENSEINIDKLNFDSDGKYIKYGIIGPIFDGGKFNVTEFRSYNRKYSTFTKTDLNIVKNIYSAPEITERGAGVKPYGGDNTFNYSNSLESIITDRHKDDGVDEGEDAEILGLNSWGEKCLTLVLGNSNQNEVDRPSLEDLKPSDIAEDNGLIISEVVRPESYIYTGNIYNGLSFENKSRTNYIEIGKYNDLTTASTEIESAGDTYVQNYIFGRILKTDSEIYSIQKMQFTEIIEHPIETTINLENRSDISLLGWDNKFQPRYDEFHKYNRVYSQSSNLITNQTDSFKFKKVKDFNTRIISSKLKIPGEFIDSWTDFLENEVIDLDGKYGSVNQIITYNDILYALQDRAVAKIGVNPRVQTQGSDGLSIELGIGGILYDYNYMTTDSGTLNKWSVFKSPYGFYYFDLLNKSLNKFNGNILNISSLKGLHSYFQNNINYSSLLNDNHLLRNGVIGGYDDINKEAIITFLQGEDSFTIGYNDKLDAFTSFYDYLPSIYINRGFRNLMIDSTNTKLYNSFEGEYNTFFDIKYPSYITLMLNPETNLDCVFDNIEFNSELYLDDIDQSDKTLTHIQAYNEYQDSGRIPLELGRNKNLRRKFRKWRADIPRDGRNRIRNPWVFLKLELDTTDNYKLVLHDIIVKYTI